PAPQFNLGVLYAKGDGVAEDYKEAMRWYAKAAGYNYTLSLFNMALIDF
ncbi:sel1 repeat family protein, partial [Pseudoalteromonas sp. S1727]